MEEQDDEIKELNELILNAKCHAIRDAQLSEKDEITTAMKEEEVNSIESRAVSIHNIYVPTAGSAGCDDGD